jgi:hypothetical protein
MAFFLVSALPLYLLAEVVSLVLRADQLMTWVALIVFIADYG